MLQLTNLDKNIFIISFQLFLTNNKPKKTPLKWWDSRSYLWWLWTDAIEVKNLSTKQISDIENNKDIYYNLMQKLKYFLEE